MAERRLIFNAKGFQLGYVEGNAVFDLNGRRRCSYTGATGNLGDFDIIGWNIRWSLVAIGRPVWKT
jgi:hypothetical protein